MLPKGASFKAVVKFRKDDLLKLPHTRLICLGSKSDKNGKTKLCFNYEPSIQDILDGEFFVEILVPYDYDFFEKRIEIRDKLSPKQINRIEEILRTNCGVTDYSELTKLVSYIHRNFIKAHLATGNLMGIIVAP